jgi:hypothetical protein
MSKGAPSSSYHTAYNSVTKMRNRSKAKSSVYQADATKPTKTGEMYCPYTERPTTPARKKLLSILSQFFASAESDKEIM